jgi:PAS domain S-box-containing protein
MTRAINGFQDRRLRPLGHPPEARERSAHARARSAMMRTMSAPQDGHTADDPRLTSSSEALYKTLVEQMPAVVYVDTCERNPRTLYLGPSALEMFGRPATDFFDDPLLWIDGVHPDDRERIETAWDDAVATDARFDQEYRWVRPDGSVVWLRDTSLVVRDDDGIPRFRQGVLFEITQSKAVEDEVRSSEARYRILVEQIPAIVYQVAPDDDRRTLWVSPAVEDALGYTRFEWLDQPDMWMELLHRDDREPTLAVYDEHNATGAQWNREYRLIASDGRAVWFRDVARLIRDDDGSPRYWLGVQLDITEQKQVEMDLRLARDDLERRVHERTAALEEANAFMAIEIGERRRVEEELRAAEHRYRTLAEQLPAVTYVWAVQPDGESVNYYTSPRIEQLLGYTLEEWHQGFDFWMSRMHPDDRARVVAATLRSERTGERFDEEYRYLDKRGEIVWVLDQATLLERDENGRPSLLQGVMVDITARKDAERRTSEAETAYRTLIEQIPAITYVEIPSDDPTESRLAYVSPQAERIIGRSVQELMDDPGHFGRILHAEDRERIIAANHGSNTSGQPFDEEYRIVRDDGRVVWLHSRAQLVRDPEGRAPYWHGVALDITAQREAEASLRDLEARYRTLSGRIAVADDASTGH